MKNNTNTSIFCYITLLLILLSNNQLLAQQTDAPVLKVTGTMQISHEYYNANTENYSFDARKPTNLTRFMLSPTLQVGSVSLPFSILISSQGTNTVTPPGQFSEAYALFKEIKSFEDLANYAKNPVNRIGVAPKYENFQAFLGTHTPNYSELTQGSISIFGAGFEWKPKKFFIGANTGTSQHSIQSDSLRNIAGAYQRRQYGIRVGYGNTAKSFVALNISGGRDNIESLTNPTTSVLPQEGLSASIQYRWELLKNITWQTEMATGLFSENTLAYKIPADEPGYNRPDFIRLYSSTVRDNAVSTALEYRQPLWNVKAKLLYVGSGYKTFGHPFFQSDRLEWTISPTANLFDRKVSISGSIGQRTNNLSGTRAAAMSQLLASANISAQINEKISLNTSYSNFGVRNVVENDTLKIENVAQNFNFTPVLILDAADATDIFTLMFSLDNFQDYNVVSGALNDNNTMIAGLTYNRSFKNNPLTIGANYMFFKLNSSAITIDNTTIGVNTGYDFFDGILNTSLGLNYLLNRPETNHTYDRQILFDFQLSYKHPKRYFARFQASNNAYSFGSVRPGAKLMETNFRIVVGKRF